MSYETLDKIADLYIPVLAFLSLLSVIHCLRFNVASVKKSGFRLFQLLTQVLMVYGLMFLDASFNIWPSLGGLDYSTHTALSLVLVVFLLLHHKKYSTVLVGSLGLYLLLMLYQQYHTVADIVVTAVVVGLVSFGVLTVVRRIC